MRRVGNRMVPRRAACERNRAVVGEHGVAAAQCARRTSQPGLTPVPALGVRVGILSPRPSIWQPKWSDLTLYPAASQAESECSA